MRHRGSKAGSSLHSRAAMWCLVVGAGLLAFSAQAAADSGSARWTLTVGMGIEEVASRDTMGSPLTYSGVGYPGVFRADVVADRWSGGAEVGGFFFGFNGGELETAYAEEGLDGHRADSVFADASVWAQRAVAKPGSHRLSLGVQVSHWTFFRSYLYDTSQIGAVETWDATLTGDVRAEVGHRIGRFQWRAGASLAVGGRIMRPSYSVRGDERIALVESRGRVLTYGSWATINRLQMLQADAAIQWDLSERWGLVAQYRFGLMSYRADAPTRAFSQRGMAGIQFRFR